MTKKLKWKDYEPNNFCSCVAEAWASRTVGGKYRIGRREGTDIFYRPNGSVWFEAERLVNTGPGAWNNSLVRVNPIARTIEQAKAAAEADNQPPRRGEDRAARPVRGRRLSDETFALERRRRRPRKHGLGITGGRRQVSRLSSRGQRLRVV